MVDLSGSLFHIIVLVDKSIKKDLMTYIRHSNLMTNTTGTVGKGTFTNYIDKKRWVGSQLFVNIYKVETVNIGR